MKMSRMLPFRCTTWPHDSREKFARVLFRGDRPSGGPSSVVCDEFRRMQGCGDQIDISRGTSCVCGPAVPDDLSSLELPSLLLKVSTLKQMVPKTKHTTQKSMPSRSKWYPTYLLRCLRCHPWRLNCDD